MSGRNSALWVRCVAVKTLKWTAGLSACVCLSNQCLKSIPLEARDYNVQCLAQPAYQCNKRWNDIQQFAAYLSFFVYVPLSILTSPTCHGKHYTIFFSHPVTLLTLCGDSCIAEVLYVLQFLLSLLQCLILLPVFQCALDMFFMGLFFLLKWSVTLYVQVYWFLYVVSLPI